MLSKKKIKKSPFEKSKGLFYIFFTPYFLALYSGTAEQASPNITLLETLINF
jgi:hypothetical protein